jgi:formyltetrahydrofolate synthetase
MAVKTDIEIAGEAVKTPITQIGAKLGILSDHMLPHGHDKAKIGQEFTAGLSGKKDGKLTLVTAWVEREGALRVGMGVTLHVPDQRAWAHLAEARRG